MMTNNEGVDESYALTTYGMNNHAVRTDQYRYIQYEDGSQELYDHSKDPNEWTNIASNAENKAQIEKMKALLPKENSKWDAESKYTFQPYFVKQKARTSVNK